MVKANDSRWQPLEVIQGQEQNDRIHLQVSVSRDGSQISYSGDREGLQPFLDGVSQLQVTLPESKEMIAAYTDRQRVDAGLKTTTLRMNNQLKFSIGLFVLIFAVVVVAIVGGRK